MSIGDFLADTHFLLNYYDHFPLATVTQWGYSLWLCWSGGLISFFKKDFIYSFLERREGREKERERILMQERNINWLPLTGTPTGDWTRNLGLCPDWESNQKPFALQDDSQPMSHTGRVWWADFLI